MKHIHRITNVPQKAHSTAIGHNEDMFVALFTAVGILFGVVGTALGFAKH